MDSIKVEALLTSLETGSILAASEQMGYTASGVNRMINALEQELGVTLLLRGRRGVELTPNGEMLLPLLRQYRKCEEDIAQLCSEINGIIRGNLRIGSFYSIAAHRLPRIIDHFLEKYPGVHIQVVENATRALAEMLRHNELDFSFMIDPEDEELTFTPLMDVPLVVWVSKRDPLAKKSSVSLSDIATRPYISRSPGRDHIALQLMSRHNIAPDIHYTTMDDYTAYRMVENNLGISINNSLVSEKWSGDVLEKPLRPSQKITVGLVVAKSVSLSPAARRFTQFAMQEMR